MSQYFSNDTVKYVIAILSFLAVLVILFFIYKVVYSYFRNRVIKTPGKIDDFLIQLFKIPLLWIIYWVLLKAFTHIFLSELSFFKFLRHTETILLIISLAWIAVQFVKAGAYYLQSKIDLGMPDNLRARKNLTQLKVFKTIINTVVVIIALAAALLTFDGARSIGVSLLTSAGIIGLILGFAAQKSLGLILSGIQIAITQPIRLDDVVIVEGEWGRIEEIALTYVVVKIWDERCMVLPVNYFLETPFQNWTRSSSNILGTIYLYVDYMFPVHILRNKLPDMLTGNPDWDGRVAGVQVTDTNERHMVLRILLSSSDASKNWNLRTSMREKLIDYINLNHPNSLSRIRIQSV
jgi:hypothetical protein